jgi:uncharacterized protein YjbI with pentapeptide repeats
MADSRGFGGRAGAALRRLSVHGTSDAHGQRVTPPKLERLLASAPQRCGRPVLHDANFRGATFTGDAHFNRVVFSGDACFEGATFEGAAHFDEAIFGDKAHAVHFEKARFQGEAHFPNARFEGPALFPDATFKGFAHFPDTTFGSEAVFRGADLKGGFRLGPALVVDRVVLDEASLGSVDMKVTTCYLCCLRTRFHDPAHVKVRCAEITLDEAVFDSASTLAFPPPWGETVNERQLLRCVPLQQRIAEKGETPESDPAMPRLTSLRGADVGNLTLADIDLSRCNFESTLRLDELRLATMCPFDKAPSSRKVFGLVPVPRVFVGPLFPPLWRWTKRITIHEERRWRVSTSRRKGWMDKSVERCPEKARLRGEAERLASIRR